MPDQLRQQGQRTMFHFNETAVPSRSGAQQGARTTVDHEAGGSGVLTPPARDTPARAGHQAAAKSVGGAKSSLGDAKSSLDDAKSSLGDAKSSLGDA